MSDIKYITAIDKDHGHADILLGMRKENLLGQRFGRLVVVAEIPSKPGKPKRPQWECKCDCGNTIVVHRGCDLKSGNTTSCGCWKSETLSKLASKRNFDGRKYDPRTATARRIYCDEYLDGDLTFEQFMELSQQACHYCGSPPSNQRRDRHKKSSAFYVEQSLFVYNGLDRIDSNIPHNYTNIVPCCKWCNYSKRERTPTQFYEWAEQLYLNLQKKKDG